MKTPREILFKRHQEAEAKLDVIRERVVAVHITTGDEKKMPLRSTAGPTLGMRLWQELVWPCRRIWLGTAATWVLILVLNLATGERDKPVADNAAPTPDVAVALKEQRQMLAQLLDAGTAAPTIRPRVPGPRSEQRQRSTVG